MRGQLRCPAFEALLQSVKPRAGSCVLLRRRLRPCVSSSASAARRPVRITWCCWSPAREWTAPASHGFAGFCSPFGLASPERARSLHGRQLRWVALKTATSPGRAAPSRPARRRHSRAAARPARRSASIADAKADRLLLALAARPVDPSPGTNSAGPASLAAGSGTAGIGTDPTEAGDARDRRARCRRSHRRCLRI